MSFIIARVSGTVGASVTIAVITEMEQKDVHTPLNVWVEDNFGMYATIEYLETYHVATISTTDLNIQRLLNLDDYLANG